MTLAKESIYGYQERIYFVGWKGAVVSIGSQEMQGTHLPQDPQCHRSAHCQLGRQMTCEAALT